jgi:cytochrome c553
MLRPARSLPLLCVLAAGAVPSAQDALAVLEQRCVSCHNPTRKKSDLDLTAREGALRGGSKGPALVPGDPEASLLTALIEHKRTPHMPLREDKLADRDVQALRAWIAAGAEYARPLTVPASAAHAAEPGELQVTDADRAFWSFAPLAAAAAPDIENPARARNDVDRFWLAALDARGLESSAPADRRTLLRRLHLTLLGLPPTPAQMSAFLADDRPDAYEHTVDALLGSAHFGERQARHWLDVARYADSGGYEFDYERPHAFPYRDFVIEAMNADMPFDEFVRLQVAADELRPDAPATWRATGFLCAGPTVDNQENEQTRYDEYDDVVSTLGSAFLGLTVGCARCHDHKFDPIPTRDYYRLVAAFSTSKRDVEPLLPRAEAETYRGRTRALDGLLEAARERERRLTGERPRGRRGGERPPRENLSAEEKVELGELRAVIADLRARRPQEPDQALVMTDRAASPEPVYLLRRGNPSDKQEELAPGFLQVVTPEQEQNAFYASPAPATPGTTGRRAALARWLTDVEHGAGRLLARVIVNRLWHWHLGRGLVATPNDFGLQGERPTHPELLDWLAQTLIDGGWKLKRVHRLIVTSALYRQASQWRQGGEARAPDTVSSDPGNRLWWRREPARLDAETLRDAVLQTSGCLNTTVFGPSVKPWMHKDAIATGSTTKWPTDVVDGPKTWRRSLYVFMRRSVRFPMLEVFDAPDATASCGRRLATTTPLQALALLNDPFVRDQAQRWAAGVKDHAGADAGAQVDRVYALALLREPSAHERVRAIAFLAAQTALHQGDAGAALTDLCQVMFNLNEFVHVD